MVPMPELERAKLRRRLQQAIDGEPADADAAVQLACLAAIGALLSVTADDDFLAVGHVHKRTGKLDALDTEVTRLTDLFVRRQPSEGARAFAQGLSETAHMKKLVEHLARPRSLWPSWLIFFGAYAARARAEGL